MSFDAVKWALSQRITPSQKLTLIVLADCYNHHSGQCNPKRDYLLDNTGLGKSALAGALADLIDLGLIARRKDFGRGYHYTLHFDVRIEVRKKRKTTNSPQIRTNGQYANGPQMRTNGEINDLSMTHLSANTDVICPQMRTVVLYGTRKMNKEHTVNGTSSDDDDLFDAFWEIWPKKTHKKEAKKAWAKITDKNATLEKIRENIELRTYACQWAVARYIPNPATYLNGEQWEDVVYDEPSERQHRHAGSIEQTLRQEWWANSE